MLCIVFTLTFDSSPIKGEGILSVGLYCSPHRLDSRLRGNDGVLVLSCFHPRSQCQALGQALILCRQGRGDLVGWCWLVVCPALWILP